MANAEQDHDQVPQQSLPPLKIIPVGDDQDEREARLQSVQPSPGYPYVVFLLADAITKRADLVLMDFTTNNVAIRYQVDGIWHNMPVLAREQGDYLLAALKQIAGLDYRERRQRQSGSFSAEYMKEKHKCRITSQGIAAGERVAMEIDRKKPSRENLEEIGMRPGQRTLLLNAINKPGGLVLFSGLPGDGLSTTWRATLQSTDRFMRDFFAVQEVSRQEPDVINIGSHTWDESRGETMLGSLRSLLLREPNAIAFTEIGSGSDLTEMSRIANEMEITVVTRIHARSAAEAVIRALMLKPDVGAFASALRVVVCQRTVRLLCTFCRQGFHANPALLNQLGLPPKRVPILYRQFQPGPDDLVDANGNPAELTPCESCSGLGYSERIGVFEVLEVDDRFRDAMKSNPTVASLTQAATESGHVSLRDESIVVVARGDTSLEEVQRALKK